MTDQNPRLKLPEWSDDIVKQKMDAHLKKVGGAFAGFDCERLSLVLGWMEWQHAQDGKAHDEIVAGLIALIKLQQEWLKKVVVGPAKTMAEPKSVWYSTHSQRVLDRVEAAMKDLGGR